MVQAVGQQTAIAELRQGVIKRQLANLLFALTPGESIYQLLDALCSVFVGVPYTKNNNSLGMSRIPDYVFSEDGVTNNFGGWR